MNDKFICKKCNSRSSFIFEPRESGSCNLNSLSRVLEAKGIKPNVLTDLILVVMHLNTQVKFFNNKKVIVKTMDELKANRILFDLLGD